MAQSKAPIPGANQFPLTRHIACVLNGALLLAGFSANLAAEPGWVFKPRLSVSEVYTDNIELAPSGEEDSELVTAITPGFLLRRDSARMRLDVDYRLRALVFAEDGDANRVSHGLNGKMNAELSDDLLYLDASARMSEAVIDARQPQSVDGISGGGNLTDLQAYTVSPYMRHNFSNYFSGLLRYGHERVYTDGALETSETNFVRASLNSEPNFGLLNWDVNYYQSREDRGSSSQLDREKIDATAGYRLHPKFSLQALGGREDNDFSTTRIPQNGSYWAVGATWTPSRYLSLTAMEGDRFKSGSVRLTPSVRTSLQVSYREREVGLNPGAVWTGDFQHRTRRTVWQLSYFEDTTTTQRVLLDQLALLEATQDALAAGNFIVLPDETFVIGVDPTGFFTLREEIFERKRGQASVSLKTGKSVFAVSAYTEKRDFLEVEGAGDPVGREQSRGAMAQWRWQFSGRSHTTVTGDWRRIEFSSDGREDDRWYIDTLLTRDLSRNAAGSVGYRFTHNESTLGTAEYSENRLIARFDIGF